MTNTSSDNWKHLKVKPHKFSFHCLRRLRSTIDIVRESEEEQGQFQNLIRPCKDRAICPLIHKTNSYRYTTFKTCGKL